MFSYIRTWWLINRLSRSVLVTSAANRTETQALNTPTAHIIYSIRLEPFLEERARKYWFGIFRLSSQMHINMRMERDGNLLRRANNMNFVQIVPDNRNSANGLVINVLPEGHFFASPMNGFAGFLREYKEAWPILTAIFMFLAAWSPVAKTYIMEIISYVVHKLIAL